MIFARARTALLAIVGSVAIAGCSYGYGGNGLNVGYGNPYYNAYGDGYGAAYGSGYGSAYAGYGSGWYDGYFYPGSGYYVYNRSGVRQRWNGNQQRYWASRADRREVRDNRRVFRTDRNADRAVVQQSRRDNRGAVRDGTINRETFRQNRQEIRNGARTERRDDRRELRRENRRDRRERPD
jgi:hypothetical protein